MNNNYIIQVYKNKIPTCNDTGMICYYKQKDKSNMLLYYTKLAQ
jgi:hypothetical protein